MQTLYDPRTGTKEVIADRWRIYRRSFGANHAGR
jgi:hypothetical protein